MKKLLSLLLTFTLSFLLLLSLTSCFKNEPHPIDAFYDKMEEESNCQLAITYSFPSVGSFGFKMKIDGNVTYIPDFYVLGEQVFEETYVKVTDDYQYVYTKDAYGDWTREKTAVSQDFTTISGNESLDFESILKSKYYEKVEGEENTYKQKSSAYFDDVEDVVITVEEDFCSIEM